LGLFTEPAFNPVKPARLGFFEKKTFLFVNLTHAKVGHFEDVI